MEGGPIFDLDLEYSNIINKTYRTLDELLDMMAKIRGAITPIFSGEIGYYEEAKATVQLLFRTNASDHVKA